MLSLFSNVQSSPFISLKMRCNNNDGSFGVKAAFAVASPVLDSSLTRPLPWHGSEAGHMCDVMMSDSLLTLCCPSVSSVDTNTSKGFQLRPALLSKAIYRLLPTCLSKDIKPYR